MAMINVTVGNNTNTDTMIVNSDMTPKEIMESAGIVINVGATHLNGALLPTESMDQKLEDLIGEDAETCFLLQIVKGDGGR